MKRIAYIAICLCVFSASHYQLRATHIVGGELNYHLIDSFHYEITLTVYRDCWNGVPPFDNPASIGFFDQSNFLVFELLIPFSGSDTIDTELQHCVEEPVNVCYEVTTYVDTIWLPPIPGGYQLAYQRCCRNGTIVNIINPNGTGATYFATLPDSGVVNRNSNPVFTQWPPEFLCTGLPFSFDHSAMDYDGDSLYYGLCDPFNGANTGTPMPQPPFNPPYPSINWQPPYGPGNIMGGSPDIQIDPATGWLTVTPQVTGQFVVGVCVSEFRDGVFLGITKRDFQFNVVPCVPLVISALQVPEVTCGDSSVTFLNQSQSASTFFWDFGDATSFSDTSSAFSPTYAYGDSGIFEVTLIANPDSICTDTSRFTIRILPDRLSTEIDYTLDNCNRNPGLVSLFGNVQLEHGVLDSLVWIVNDTLNYYDNTSVNYTFSAIDTHHVSLVSITENGCRDTISLVVPLALDSVQARFDYQVPHCLPTDVEFENLSVGATSHCWEFSNIPTSDTSTLEHPTYTYWIPGDYLVTLVVKNENACRDTISSLITIGPDDITTLSSATPNTIHSETEVQLFTSADVAFYQWTGSSNIQMNDQQQAVATVNETTTFFVLLTDSNGCSTTDTVLVQYEGNPCELPHVYIPNAFSPNGDGNNDLLYVRGSNIEHMHLQIYDRWGELMFESKDQNQGWDGNYGDQNLPAQVFAYILSVECIGGANLKQQGNITLIR